MNRIAIDIDEVLVHFVKPMAKHNKLKMPTKNKYNYVYRNMFSITEKESTKMVRDFYDSETFKNLKPIQHSNAAIQSLRDKCDKLYIVTGRQTYARENTETWLDKHFPGMFDDLILTNSYSPHEIQKDDICRSLNIDTIIDDNDMICGLCKNAGINSIHFAGYDGSVYPWCHEDSDSVLSWLELHAKL